MGATQIDFTLNFQVAIILALFIMVQLTLVFGLLQSISIWTEMLVGIGGVY